MSKCLIEYKKCIICDTLFIPKQKTQLCCSFKCRVLSNRKRSNSYLSYAKTYRFGEKTKEFPFGYGYCQCGCGKKARELSNRIYSKFHPDHQYKLAREFKLARQHKVERERELRLRKLLLQKLANINAHMGKISKEYTKGWGYCQCGCGQKTRITIKKINGKQILTARKYVGSHFTKTELFSQLASERLKQRDYLEFNAYVQSKHGMHYSDKLGEEIGYMSSFEQAAFEILDNDPAVITYVAQPFTIGYFFRGRKRGYNPDILVRYKNNEETIIEVKPKSKLKDPQNLAKIEALKEFCKQKRYLFEIWDEDILKNKARLLLTEVKK